MANAWCDVSVAVVVIVEPNIIGYVLQLWFKRIHILVALLLIVGNCRISYRTRGQTLRKNLHYLQIANDLDLIKNFISNLNSKLESINYKQW